MDGIEEVSRVLVVPEDYPTEYSDLAGPEAAVRPDPPTPPVAVRPDEPLPPIPCFENQAKMLDTIRADVPFDDGTQEQVSETATTAAMMLFMLGTNFVARFPSVMPDAVEWRCAHGILTHARVLRMLCWTSETWSAFAEKHAVTRASVDAIVAGLKAPDFDLDARAPDGKTYGDHFVEVLDAVWPRSPKRSAAEHSAVEACVQYMNQHNHSLPAVFERVTVDGKLHVIVGGEKLEVVPPQDGSELPKMLFRQNVGTCYLHAALNAIINNPVLLDAVISGYRARLDRNRFTKDRDARGEVAGRLTSRVSATPFILGAHDDQMSADAIADYVLSDDDEKELYDWVQDTLLWSTLKAASESRGFQVLENVQSQTEDGVLGALSMSKDSVRGRILGSAPGKGASALAAVASGGDSNNVLRHVLRKIAIEEPIAVKRNCNVAQASLSSGRVFPEHAGQSDQNAYQSWIFKLAGGLRVIMDACHVGFDSVLNRPASESGDASGIYSVELPDLSPGSRDAAGHSVAYRKTATSFEILDSNLTGPVGDLSHYGRSWPFGLTALIVTRDPAHDKHVEDDAVTDAVLDEVAFDLELLEASSDVSRRLTTDELDAVSEARDLLAAPLQDEGVWAPAQEGGRASGGLWQTLVLASVTVLSAIFGSIRA